MRINWKPFARVGTTVEFKWSVYTLVTRTIGVQIRLKSTVFILYVYSFLCNIVFEKNENKPKEARVGPLF